MVRCFISRKTVSHLQVIRSRTMDVPQDKLGRCRTQRRRHSGAIQKALPIRRWRATSRTGQTHYLTVGNPRAFIETPQRMSRAENMDPFLNMHPYTEVQQALYAQG